MRTAALLIVLLSVSPRLCGQAIPPRDTSAARGQPDLESVLEQSSQDLEDSQLIDLLARLQEDPLDVNEATAEQLQQIPGITPIIAFNIVAFRAQARITKLEDMRLVEGVTSDLLWRIEAFVRFGRPPAAEASGLLTSVSLRSRMVEDLQLRAGFVEGTYRGTRPKLYNRIRARVTAAGDDALSSRPGGSGEEPTSAELGVVTEKDAGESRITDFVAGYVTATLPGISTRFILGDFVMESGEGLVFWRSVGLSKGSEVVGTVRKNGGGIRPYLSTDENWYFRGFAAEVSSDWWNLSLMYSNKPLHASADEEGRITSFDDAGLFRTEGELGHRNRTRERLVGGRLSASPLAALKIGAAGYAARFLDPLKLSGVGGFSGQDASVVGWDISYTREWVNLFSELARDRQNLVAGVAGLLLKPHRTVDVACFVRSYPERFVSLHSNAFGETGGVARNESGAYLALSIRPFPGFEVSTYFDQFGFPGRSFYGRFPATGHDFLTASELAISRKLRLQVQFKEKTKSDLGTGTDAFDRLTALEAARTQRNYRATVEFNSSATFRWRSRIEVVTVGYTDSRTRQRGALLFQDIRLFPLPRLQLDARVIVFHTDSFDSRLYEFENDLAGTLSNPALFGRGLRWYLLARYEVAAVMDVWMKYSQTTKDGVKTIGSGPNEIVGDREGRVSVQIDVRF